MYLERRFEALAFSFDGLLDLDLLRDLFDFPLELLEFTDSLDRERLRDLRLSANGDGDLEWATSSGVFNSEKI